jgi:hypothetical protein
MQQLDSSAPEHSPDLGIASGSFQQQRWPGLPNMQQQQQQQPVVYECDMGRMVLQPCDQATPSPTAAAAGYAYISPQRSSSSSLSNIDAGAAHDTFNCSMDPVKQWSNSTNDTSGLTGSCTDLLRLHSQQPGHQQQQ